MRTSRKHIVGVVLAWTLGVTTLRAVRLPNDFSKAHWLIDYRFGLVKRGLVGEIVTLLTRAAHTRPTDRLISVLAGSQFAIFCVVLLFVGFRILRRSEWSKTAILTVLVFFSSPFVVISAHLVGYFDNIIIVLTVISVGLLLRGRVWTAAWLQAISILVHENALLVGFPVFCLAWQLLDSRNRESGSVRLPLWPVLLPVGTFLILVLGQSLAPRDVEQSLTSHLSTFSFIQTNLPNTRVPHWIMITFYDSYVLHQGLLAGRLLSASMHGLIFPSMLALLACVVEIYGIPVVSAEAAIVLWVCLVPQLMHALAWDTSRIWTYSIVSSFLVLWVYAELFSARRESSSLVNVLCLGALVLNIMVVTPLMDGLHDRLALTTRLLAYAPALGVALALLVRQDPESVAGRILIGRWTLGDGGGGTGKTWRWSPTSATARGRRH